MKSGFIAIVGEANVGKSTIINNILKKKISIVSYKAQTTRDAIKGIYNDENHQIVFIDTPGVQKQTTVLSVVMNRTIDNSLLDIEGVIFVVNNISKSKESKYLIEKLKKVENLIVVVNKIDLKKINEVQEILGYYRDLFPRASFIEMSAIDDFNTDTLINKVKEILPEGPLYYDQDIITDSTNEFFIKEVIREKVLKLLKQEVPHQIGIAVLKLNESEKEIVIDATIVVAKESHKGIVIGKNGSLIKRIGSYAREDLEKKFKKHVYLDLFVSVKKDWINNIKVIKDLGYK